MITVQGGATTPVLLEFKYGWISPRIPIRALFFIAYLACYPI